MIRFRTGYGLDDIKYYLLQWWWGQWNWIGLRLSTPRTIEGSYKGRRFRFQEII